MQHLHSHTFQNEFVSLFAGDESGSLQPRQTPGVLWSKAAPTPVKEPKLLAWSEDLARELGMASPNDADVKILGGNLTTSSMQPYAACYAGHQFGQWAGQLGDGRAITLGEWVAPSGVSWELQLKGAGPTAYSRRADGRAVLRSSVREYLMSEAMYYLGVPTTRALSLVSTGDGVMRDMFYNGNAAFEPGAIVMRVAPSFLRFGSFEMPAARQELDNLRQLTDWTIACYYPQLQGDNKIVDFFSEVVARTARLMVEWMRVGFVHGVMNTDNMSILGLTIDYGPYSFLDDFDPDFTPNTTDLPGRRYAFGNQASMGYWNLGRLASALAPLLEDTEPLVAALKEYEAHFWDNYHQMMVHKLGLDELRGEEDKTLISLTAQTLALVKPDMTIFYQLLMELPPELEDRQPLLEHFSDSFYSDLSGEQAAAFLNLIRKWKKRVSENKGVSQDTVERMRNTNPRFILRNYLLHQAIEGLEKGDATLFEQLQQALKDPYSKNWDQFLAKRPEWASKKAGCSMLSCSS
jgi:serine/tyrosine/threonine adenylyltransferase